MQRLKITSFTAIFCALALNAASALPTETPRQEADTITVIDNSTRVIVTKDGNTTQISTFIDDGTGSNIKEFRYTVQVKDSSSAQYSDDMEDRLFNRLPFLGTKRNAEKESRNRPYKPQRYVTGARNIYWGWNFGYDGIKGIRNCFEVGVAELLGVEWRPWRNGPDFSVGIGFGMKRFRAADRLVFGKEESTLVLDRVDDNLKVDKARWDVWAIHLPLTAGWNFAKNLRIAAGAIINFNTYSKAWSAVTLDGVRYTETFTGLQQRLLTADLIAMAGFSDGFGIYAKWSPIPVMQQCYGPRFRTWSLGVTLNF